MRRDILCGTEKTLYCLAEYMQKAADTKNTAGENNCDIPQFTRNFTVYRLTKNGSGRIVVK